MHYLPETPLKDLLAKIEAYLAAGNHTQASEEILHLQTQAVSTQDWVGQAAVAVYSGVLAFAEGNMDESIKLREKALAIGLAHDVPYYSMRAYNGLAAVYAEQGDYYASLGNYLNAYHITSLHREFGYIGVVLNNIGNLFVWLDEYGTAIGYLTNAFDAFRETGSGDRGQLVSIVRNLIEAYSCAGEFTRAKEWAEKEAWPFTPKEKITVDCMIMANDVQEHYEQGEVDKSYEAIEQFLTQAEHTDEFLYMFRSYLNVGKVSIELGDHDLATRAMECLIELDKRATIDTFRQSFATLRALYYRQFLRPEQENDLADSYYEPYFFQSLKTIDQLKHTYLSSLMMELEMDKAKFTGNSVFRKSFRLRKDLELDPLTNLLNRASGERYISDRLAGKTEGDCQVMIFVSIDHFKRINDTYGHHFGDMLLLAVTDIINEDSTSDSTTCRFGGGEFITFEDHAVSLEQVCARVQNNLYKGNNIALPDDLIGQVSFSVGIYYIRETVTFTDAIDRVARAMSVAAKAGMSRYIVYEEGI